MNPALSPVLVPWWWSLPFALLLASIAFVPLISKHHWERYYHFVAIVLGALVASVYCTRLGAYGQQRMLDTFSDYFKFMALIGSLYVISGGILLHISGNGRPSLNTAILTAGTLAGSVLGTTGAAVLFIRPFLRVNRGRLKPFHVVFFIFIVCNAGGLVTPIGPPLFLGYLYGVPFAWTAVHLWQPWLFVQVALLAVFFVLDSFDRRELPHETTRLKVSGFVNFICLGLVLLGIFLDKILAERVSPAFESYPCGAVLMILAAAIAYRCSNPESLAHNEFSFAPLKEVAWLFAGIFATMVPALDYLSVNASALGFKTPGDFYFGSGVLSAVLDNAPTYLNFLSAAHGVAGIPFSKQDIHLFIANYPQYLRAVSLGSALFGACTYIGNGPNFMVKAIAEAHGAPVPSFFGFIFKYALPILGPLYVAVWWLFLR